MAQACKLRHGIMCGTGGSVAAALILCTMHDWPISASLLTMLTQGRCLTAVPAAPWRRDVYAAKGSCQCSCANGNHQAGALLTISMLLLAGSLRVALARLGAAERAGNALAQQVYALVGVVLVQQEAFLHVLQAVLDGAEAVVHP